MAEAVDEFLKKQNVIYEQMKTFCSNWTAQENKSAAYIEARIEGWEKYWDTFIEVDYNLQIEYKAARDAEKSYFKTNAFAKIEGYYYNMKGVMSGELKTLQAVERDADRRPNNNKKTNECKLPILEPPKFDGNFLDWPSFSDLFKSTIHNNGDLSSAQKLQYLKASLIGDASKILRTTQVTDNNYEPAWKSLEERFENKNALVQAQIQALFTQPKASNIDGIKSIYDVTIDCLQSLENMDVKTEHWDPMLIYMTFEKLPPTTQNLWKQQRFGLREVPKWTEMKTFLQSCFTSGEMEQPKQPTSNAIHHKQPFKRTQTMHTVNPSVCRMQDCNDKHSIRICPSFLKLSVADRIDKARQLGLCLNCLGMGHRTVQCGSDRKCWTCHKKHHTLLHLPTDTNINTSDNKTITMNTLIPERQIKSAPVLLATAIVNVQSKFGIVHQLRALIDNGSQSSFITERAVQLLKLKKSASRTQVYGLGRCDAGTSVNTTKFIVGSLCDPLFALEIEALVMPKLTNLMPSENINIREWDHLTGIQLADPEFFEPKHVDILIGANVYSSIILDGTKIGGRGTPLAQRTVFGWILTGPTNRNNNKTNYIVTLHQQTQIDHQLRLFFEQEEMSTERQLTEDERTCEQHFQETHYRDDSGRYVVSLPFKTNLTQPYLGESYKAACHRLKSLERRLQRETHFAQEYAKCLNEYLLLDHLELVETLDATNNINYLAHQAVFKLSSATTQLRVVFDASNKTTNGRSLNEVLLVGPRLQQDLAFILLRWRKHKFVLSADVEKMYRQVLLNPEHRDYHRILWRSRPSDEIKIYRMKRVTFGVSSAQYLAVKSMQQLARDESDNFPLASAAVLQDFYVDDLYTGADTIEIASEMQKQLTSMCQRGGFPLRQWSSNYIKLLENIPATERANKSFDYEGNSIVKTLGVMWTPKKDHFVFRVTLPDTRQLPTKRTILSDIARMYDPPGWLAPIIIVAKLVLKRLWILGKDWDEELPADIVDFWTDFRSKLKSIERIAIPRWINFEGNPVVCELHGFCDASEKGFAAVVYAKIIDSNQIVHVNILASKTRVSPMKPVSLPRLELCGAVLLAKLMKKIHVSMVIEWTATHAWCDSQITLSWIHSEPQRLKTYVANRVVDIHDNLNNIVWHYIRSAENPADCASRGIDPNMLAESNLWWSGPSWLQHEQSQWPNEKWSYERDTGEEKKEAHVLFSTKEKSIDLNDVFDKYSSLIKIFRIIAYCRRFVLNSKKPKCDRINGPLQAEEVEGARKLCVQWVQRKAFTKEIEEKKSKPHQPVHAKSKLRKLNPFWDSAHELLRVDGRLKNADIPYDEKCPVILPKDNRFTILYIQHVHELTLHGGVQMVIAYIRRRYWLLDARNTVRHQLWKCVKCFRFKAERSSQLMAALPPSRVNFNRCFAHVGIDFAGPIDLKSSIGRGKSTYKGYFAIFICLASKAIHIEAVTGLSTDKFIAAFDRFVGRRGLCTDVYSDCGTNFIGARKEFGVELQQCLQQTSKAAAEILSKREMNWHFNPPAAPHFGGLWEAGVKSIKYHLKRSFANKVFTYEELATALCQIEACVNSRPLCPMYADPDDLSFLTPAHLLGIDAPLSRPEPSVLNLNENRLNRWQHIRYAAQNFWKNYSGEFLSRMQQRPKWNAVKRNMAKGDMVVLRDENISPTLWQIGRVVDTHAGSDGLVRVVSVRTSSGVYKRPIAKLALLPVTDNYESHTLTCRCIPNVKNNSN